METITHTRNIRGRGAANGIIRPHSRNKHWSAGEGSPRSVGNAGGHVDGERWERGGHRGGGRGRGNGRGGSRKFPNVSLRVQHDTKGKGRATEVEDQVMQDEEYHEEETHPIVEPELESQEEREKFYQELVKAREAERKKAIAEGKMDDPMVPKRLEDAITMVGTCLDMCPRFERYRRERENNLFEWETIPGTKRIDHKRAVKMYERAAGDKTLPSDLRPPHVLKRTLDYLFHDLLPRGGFSATFNFIRDRSRAVRNDFTMQHETGPLAIECHDRCARFHILALHFERERPGFSLALEEQQLMNTLQSLKEFYEDQRGRYESPTELEMRVYHRLIHIRDQRERHEDIPEHITSHPVFKLTTNFRICVQKKSAPITKISALVVDDEAMQIFAELAAVLKEQGNVIMIYLVACILERLFGKDAIQNIEGIRGDLSIPEVIDGGVSITEATGIEGGVVASADEEMVDELDEEFEEEQEPDTQPLDTITSAAAASLQPSATQGFNTSFDSQPFTSSTSLPATSGSSLAAPTAAASGSAFASLTAAPNPFGTASVFGTPPFKTSSVSVFGAKPEQPKSIFGQFVTTVPPVVSSVPPSTGTTTTNGVLPTLFGGAISTAAAPKPSAFESSAAPSTTASAPPNSNVFGLFSQLSNTSATSTGWGGLSAPTAKPEPSSTQYSNIPSVGKAPPQPTLNPQAPAFTPSLFKPSSSFSFSAPLKPSHSESEVAPAANSHSAAPTTFTPPPSLSFTKSASPSLNRASATPPLKIDTSVHHVKPAPIPYSPANPPSLQRVQPISLPSTPTIDVQPSNPMLDHLKSSLEAGNTPSLSRSNTEILSPLVLSSPSTSSFFVNNFTPKGTPSAKRIRTEFSFPKVNGSIGNGKEPESDARDVPKSTVEDLMVKALRFSQTGSIVKHCFGHWKGRVTDKAAWLEACRHSESYRRKLYGERQSRTNSPDKKRRISTTGIPVSSEPVQKKRLRKRISDYQPPRTDEDLARRLKENHEEHERRWAQGSFLQVIRTHVKGKLKAPPKLPWNIWLSMNPDSDATAIWLERKFDVPGSGSWVSDTVFSIPLAPMKNATTPGDPGLIVFECTPIEGPLDDIERKYRILDDCSRLRDIINSLPPKRRFISSLLICCWTDGEKAYEGTDFLNMASKLVSDSTIQSYHVLPMSTAMKDPDQNLTNCLPSLTLDVEGKLAQNLTVRGVFKKFDSLITSFVTEWIENCNVNGYFNWNLYCRVVQASVALLNIAGERSLQLLNSSKIELLQSFDFLPVDDSNSVYDTVGEWLSNINQAGDIDTIALDIQAHRNINQDFPAQAFIDHLLELLHLRLGRHVGKDLETIYYIPVTDIKSAIEEFKNLLQPHQLKLAHTLNLSVRRSPKRRGTSADTERTSPGAKRMRLTQSTSSVASSTFEECTPPSSPLANGRNTPSPTNSMVSLATTATTEAPSVTVAMLRALTKDLKRKYASGT